MISTYKISEYSSEDTSVKVIYENSDGLVHQRIIRIPRLKDGSIDEKYFQEILDGQLRGVNRKNEVNAIQFGNPNTEENL